MAAKKETGANVTRITASGSTKKTTAKKQTSKAISKKQVRAKRVIKTPVFLKPLVLIGGYFKGAWSELRQVRWPNRKATWSLTGAVLAFTAFFVVLVLLLDALFKYIFEIILG